MEKYQTTGSSVIRRPCPVVRYSNKVRIFSKENWFISKRNMELFHDRVRPCHWKVSKCKALGWLGNLSTGLAKNIKFEIFGCLEALENCT